MQPRSRLNMPLAKQINALLPQTQCTKCDFDGCRPYAEAIASGAADINQCPPGGDSVVEKLAQLLARETKPLNPHNGLYRPPSVARIIEETCIGCARCLKACPVDAILGANKFMHTVIDAQCTGCELCLPVCIAFSGGLSSALSSAHWAGESTIGKIAGLFVGLLAGLAAYSAFQAVATRLTKHSQHSPDRPPTFRQGFPFMLLYLGAVIGIIASINIASWLGRLVLNHAMA